MDRSLIGMDYKLAREFEEFKALHKYSVLMGKMINYYETIMANEIQLPPCFNNNDTPEKRAEREVRALFYRDKNEFNRLYEKAWQDIAEMMD